MNTRTQLAAVASLFIGASSLVSCDDQHATSIAPRTTTARKVASEDWPAIHGPHQDSTSTESKLDWSWPAEGPPILWERSIGKGYAVPVARSERVVAFHRIDDEERLECFDAETGDRLWIASHPTSFVSRHDYSDGPYATPVLTADSVFSLSAEGILRKTALSDGNEAWNVALADMFEAAPLPFAVGTSPLVENDLIIVNIGGTRGDSGIVAVRLDSGKIEWTATSHGGSYATPRSATIANERYVFVLTDRALVALDPADGRVRWQVPFGLKGGPERVTAVSPLVVDDLVVVTAGPGAGALAIRVLPNDQFEEVWRDRRALDSQFNNLTTNGNEIFGFTSMWNGSAELRCLDLATGEIHWSHQSKLLRGSSLLVEQKLVLLGENGHLAIVDAAPDGPRERHLSSKPVLRGPTYTSPCLHKGRLYLRNEERLVCLDLRPADK